MEVKNLGNSSSRSHYPQTMIHAKVHIATAIQRRKSVSNAPNARGAPEGKTKAITWI